MIKSFWIKYNYLNKFIKDSATEILINNKTFIDTNDNELLYCCLHNDAHNIGEEIANAILSKTYEILKESNLEN